ncbi:hypothetical protein B5X24_HaOG208500 [Helicoverpa armigera]|uniref:Uncharacterized protein n=1 Tax=Helicoverpa armigera TaxID=29058 RepID=A0A2W1BGJ7_HELAM|nr:hypothetical protein B5X24_HaOG208500 [Helicoverpa armigera]
MVVLNNKCDNGSRWRAPCQTQALQAPLASTAVSDVAYRLATQVRQCSVRHPVDCHTFCVLYEAGLRWNNNCR